MNFEILISLLGLLIAIANLALDAIIYYADRKRKRPDKRSRFKG